MIEDRNKTIITRNVTSAAVRYLEWRGCKPLETEVPLCEGWLADVAGVLSPTITELVALKFIKCRPKYDDQAAYREWWEVAKRMQKLMTVLVEVKISRSDFRSDKKWALAIPVNIAYLAVPTDLPLCADEVPASWGILEYRAGTEDMRQRRVPIIQDVGADQQRDVIFQIAVRRDHHTRYERMREFRRGIVAVQNKDISRTRMQDATRAVMSILEGKHGSVEGALSWHGVKHLRDDDLERLQTLWALKTPKTPE